MNQSKVGQFIKKIRTTNGLTQKEFGKIYGVTYQAVSKWENGKNIPDISLLKQMSQDFNVDIESILEGEMPPSPKTIYHNYLPYAIIVVLLVIVISFIIRGTQSTFEFKTLSSSCDEFTISGVIAYDKTKSSIHISNIDYCKGNDQTLYEKIECTLYEQVNNTQTKIGTSNYHEQTPITLEDYLKSVNFDIDNYPKTCREYTQHSLFLQINAQDENGKITTYQIPLNLKDCDSTTS